MTSSALLVMDLQHGIVNRYGGAAQISTYLARVSRAADAARDAGIPVIYVRVGFRDGHPEVSSRNKSFAALASGGGLRLDDEATAVVDEVAPKPGEVVVVKKRISAFAGSDLEQVLRGGNIETLVLAGIATSGVVLSTVRQAADLDYGLVVLADGCLDADDEVHRVLTEKVFPRQAEVTDVDSWITSL